MAGDQADPTGLLFWLGEAGQFPREPWLPERGAVWQKGDSLTAPLSPRLAPCPTLLQGGRHTGWCQDPGARALQASRVSIWACPPALHLTGRVTLGKSLTLSLPLFPCLQSGDDRGRAIILKINGHNTGQSICHCAQNKHSVKVSGGFY